ncbi:hypothetical protein J437_LFUL004560 [Ladona fulva]|uniref:PiggyBac transposable element-derived protein domain-containing protein n=1 Tax=Ladona fulva TaxID=123851 RepID=A0A8K0JUK8_LADFU|nr:hypothetical protein J437_LFUL004560 [Ladona fulva]
MKDTNVTHATIRKLTRVVEGVGLKFYMDNFFSSSILYDNLQTKKIYGCGTVRQNRKGMLEDLGSKTVRLRCGEICSWTRDDLTAIVWKDKRNMCLLSNIHNSPEEENFCHEEGKAVKLTKVDDYNHHIGYVDKGDR